MDITNEKTFKRTGRWVVPIIKWDPDSRWGLSGLAYLRWIRIKWGRMWEFRYWGGGFRIW